MCAHADSDTFSNSNSKPNGYIYSYSDSFTDVETYRYAKATPYTGAAP